ncbi:uncharacterized protein LOC129716980 [Wyeomyia smithii]|uniref:uncharacterized protein LOC129716980 n=1 Tax=Wyeomyia smithii TaxID=174621 RepID=UPI002467BE52|nr:uncharacterized protein LOC129716980 [Wyeomyia smithii]
MNPTSKKEATSVEGLPNSFARGGIQRSTQKKAETDAVKSGGGKVNTPVSTPDITVDGPLLIKAIEKSRDKRPRVAALSEQLDAIIEFATNRTELVERAEAAEKEVWKERATESKGVQTDAPTFAVICSTGQTTKPTRQSLGEAAPENVKKRLVALSTRGSTPTGTRAEVSTGAATAGNPWVTVIGKGCQEGRKRQDGAAKKRPLRAKKAKSRGDALILRTDGSKYSEVLKKMRGETQLKELGADVRSIRRSRTGEIILELRKDAKNKGASYKAVAEQVLGKDVQVRALTSEVTLQLKNLDEIDIAQALKEKCGVEVATESIRLRKGPAGTQVATFRLASADVNLALKEGQLKVGWSVCPLGILQQPDVCFRCFEGGHKSWTCKGPDRSQLCRRCGGAGHKAKDCGEPPTWCVPGNGTPNTLWEAPGAQPASQLRNHARKGEATEPEPLLRGSAAAILSSH